MFADDIRRALQGTPRDRLAELSAAVWKGFACGAVSEGDAQQLAEEIAARKVIPPELAEARRTVGSRPRTSASIERRRAWTASGWMPPAIAARFTMGEQAAIAVIIAEAAKAGRCGLPIGAIAGRAGVCATTVRNALRQARTLGIVAVEQRRLSYDRSLPNLVTIISRELALWVRTRARIELQGGGCKIVVATTNHLSLNDARPSAMARDRGNREREEAPFRLQRRAGIEGRWRRSDTGCGVTNIR